MTILNEPLPSRVFLEYQTNGAIAAREIYRIEKSIRAVAVTDTVAVSEIAKDFHDYEFSESLLCGLIKEYPADIDTRNLLATTRIQKGDFDGAINELEAALAINDSSGKTYFNLAQICRASASDPMIDKMESLLRSADLTKNDEYAIHLALGKLYDDIGEYGDAFRHIDYAKQSAPIKYDHKAHTDFFKKIKRTFTAEVVLDKENESISNAEPVFIVGMPRSGSSLLEKLIANEPGYASIGERAEMSYTIFEMENELKAKHGYLDTIPSQSARDLQVFGMRYIEKLKNIAPDSRHKIDKNLLNFQRCGLIGLMLPTSTIIHSRRNIMDTCLSCYFQTLDPAMFPFSFSLESIGAYYSIYSDLMAHWDQVMPRKIIHVDYETVIENPDQAIKTIVGSPNRAAETNSPVSTGIVATASAWQARQPIYETSIERWKNYESYLDPLIQSLEKCGVLQTSNVIH